MGNRGLGVVNHAAELGEEIAELMSRSDRREDYWYTAEEVKVLTPMAMSGASFCISADTTRFDEALAQYKANHAPKPEYVLAWECGDCGHRYYGDLPPVHCLGCQGSHYRPLKLRVQDAEQSDAVPSWKDHVKPWLEAVCRLEESAFINGRGRHYASTGM